MLDSSPTKVHTGKTPEDLMELRPREVKKELAGNFKFAAADYLDKFHDTIRAKGGI